jgi:hypothetical protein
MSMLSDERMPGFYPCLKSCALHRELSGTCGASDDSVCVLGNGKTQHPEFQKGNLVGEKPIPDIPSERKHSSESFRALNRYIVPKCRRAFFGVGRRFQFRAEQRPRVPLNNYNPNSLSPGWLSDRRPSGQRKRRTSSSIGRSLMLVRRRRIKPCSSERLCRGRLL